VAALSAEKDSGGGPHCRNDDWDVVEDAAGGWPTVVQDGAGAEDVAGG
jgi:hypothetical protein